MQEYILIKSQKNAFDNAPQRSFNTIKIRQQPLFKDRNDQIDLVWINCLNGGMGVCSKLGFNNNIEKKYANEFMPAYEDLSLFEESSQTPEIPFVLHRMGYFKNAGTRDLSIFRNDGSIDIISYDLEGQGEKSRTVLRLGDNSNVALVNRFKEMIKETPTALFFLHRPGKIVNFDLYDLLFDILHYTSVKEQISKVSIPKEQRLNVYLLSRLEDLTNYDLFTFTQDQLDVSQDNLGSKENICRRMFSYNKEKDNEEYWFFVNGHFGGYNNKRAMPNYLKLIDKLEYSPIILVHKIGSQLDFSLTDKLKEDDSTSLWEREKPRN